MLFVRHEYKTLKAKIVRLLNVWSGPALSSTLLPVTDHVTALKLELKQCI